MLAGTHSLLIPFSLTGTSGLSANSISSAIKIHLETRHCLTSIILAQPLLCLTWIMATTSSPGLLESTLDPLSFISSRQPERPIEVYVRSCHFFAQDPPLASHLTIKAKAPSGASIVPTPHLHNLATLPSTALPLALSASAMLDSPLLLSCQRKSCLRAFALSLPSA